jgi:hypothetical protein
LTSYFDSTLNFEFRTSFCQHLSVIVFDLSHLFCKKVRLQGFIKKFIIPEPSEINNYINNYIFVNKSDTICHSPCNQLGNRDITVVENQNDLGVLVNNKLNWGN